MAEVDRTLVKSAPELWELLDDERRMRQWAASLTGSEHPVQVTVCERSPPRRLVWEARTPDARQARIEAELHERMFGTQVRIQSTYRAQGLLPGRRRQREQRAEQRLGKLLDGALEEMGFAQRRPFTAR